MPFGAAITEVAIREGYLFEGWYTDKGFQESIRWNHAGQRSDALCKTDTGDEQLYCLSL